VDFKAELLAVMGEAGVLAGVLSAPAGLILAAGGGHQGEAHGGDGRALVLFRRWLPRSWWPGLPSRLSLLVGDRAVGPVEASTRRRLASNASSWFSRYATRVTANLGLLGHDLG
jgi:hypothetical protein